MKLRTLTLAVVFLTHPVFAITSTEEETVRETTDAVLEQLNQNRDRLQKKPESIQQLVRELIVPHFDFEQMSKLVMGNYWQKFDESEQACFVSGFRNLLVESYAYILLSYDEQHISYEFTKDIGNNGYRLVRQTISREGAKPLPIEYAMEQSGDEWKAVDLIVDGVSLVRAHRSMFQSRIHTQGRAYFIGSFPECNE
ncbi:MAG: phospholipid transport system substrate-binding protein [Gammaproteobacteria bacterium]|jgi:phospholipid transport system substrate-binding protein